MLSSGVTDQIFPNPETYSTHSHSFLFTLLTSYHSNIVLHKTAPLNRASSLTPISFPSIALPLDFDLFMLTASLTLQHNMAGVMLLLLLLLRIRGPQAKEQQNKIILT